MCCQVAYFAVISHDAMTYPWLRYCWSSNMYGIFQWMPYILLRTNLQVVTFKTITVCAYQTTARASCNSTVAFCVGQQLLNIHYVAADFSLVRPWGCRMNSSPRCIEWHHNMSVVCSYVCGRGLLISLHCQHWNTECIFQSTIYEETVIYLVLEI